MIFTSFLKQFPRDDTMSVDSSLHYSSCLLSLTQSFCFRQELVHFNFLCILFSDSAQLLPVFDVLSEQIVTSELLLRQCLSVLVKEMTFDWPQPSPQSVLSPALQWFSFAVPAPHPQYPSIQQREKTFFLALNPFTIPSSSLNVRLLVCLLRWCWLQ